MTRDEHNQITEFFTRALHGKDGAPPAQMDFEADAIIRALFVRNQEAPYRITMLALSQARELEAHRAEISETKQQSRLGWLRSVLRKRARQNFNVANLRRDTKG